MTGDIQDSRDWAFDLLLRQQHLRLRLRDVGPDQSGPGSARALKPGGPTRNGSLAALAATAERLCAHTTRLRAL
jgi:hypothetical protein